MLAVDRTFIPIPMTLHYLQALVTPIAAHPSPFHLPTSNWSKALIFLMILGLYGIILQISINSLVKLTAIPGGVTLIQLAVIAQIPAPPGQDWTSQNHEGAVQMLQHCTVTILNTITHQYLDNMHTRKCL